MKQVEMARKLGISKSYLSMILSGQRTPTPQLAQGLRSLGIVNCEANFSLRGRCPRPLDECSARNQQVRSSQKFVKELFDTFIQSRPQGISQRSVESYHYTLIGFIGYPLTTEGITRYLNSLSCNNGKLKFYSCLRALFNWLFQNDYIPANPIERVSPPRIQKKLMPAVSREQLEVLLNHCRCERDKALISLLWYSGMRIAEAINITAHDFNWNDGTVVVLGKGNQFRRCLAGNGLIKKWFSDHDSFEVAKGGAQTMLKRLKADSGIQCNAHSFRRGFCIHQVKSGLSTRVVQSLGGWETISMVEHYSKSLTFEDAVIAYHRVTA